MPTPPGPSPESGRAQDAPSMVERVARRFYEEHDLGRQQALAFARTAIEAMREPTERMAYIASWAVGPGGDGAKMRECATVFTTMVDEALKSDEPRPEQTDSSVPG